VVENDGGAVPEAAAEKNCLTLKDGN